MISSRKNLVRAMIPTSSMADIAFLLIVFFLLTTSMSDNKGLGLTLPKPGTVTPVPLKNITYVVVNADGTVIHDDTGVDMNTLRENIRSLTHANPSLIVSIKTEPNAKYQYFVSVIDQIKRAGNDKISIAGD